MYNVQRMTKLIYDYLMENNYDNLGDNIFYWIEEWLEGRMDAGNDPFFEVTPDIIIDFEKFMGW